VERAASVREPQHLLLTRPRDRCIEKAGDTDCARQPTIGSGLDEAWREESQRYRHADVALAAGLPCGGGQRPQMVVVVTSGERTPFARMSRWTTPLGPGMPRHAPGKPAGAFSGRRTPPLRPSNPLPRALPRPWLRAVTSSKNTPFPIPGRASTRSRAHRDGRSRMQVAERHAPRRMCRRCRGSPACAASQRCRTGQ
jgi:hypothetical protein